MGLELLCMAIIALFVGMAICFGGYRWFMLLLPIFGFVFGFGLGLDTMQSLFGTGALATVTGWVVGFIVALIFAVLSYLFYFIGVALLGGALGYAIGVGFLGLFGIGPNFLTWIVGMILGIIFAIGTIALNLQKWVIIAATAFGGAGVIIGTFLMVFGVVPPTAFGSGAVRAAIADSWFWLFGFLVLAVLGLVSQLYTGRDYQIEAYENRI
jgi:Domain of unknown function (DUF4203)